MDITTVTIPPYGALRVNTDETLAYLNGDAPSIYLRIGSDAVRLKEGHCIPVASNFVQIVNPYPRQVELLIGRGLPAQQSNYARELSAEQRLVVSSYLYKIKDAATQTAGTRYGIGMLMKRGRANISFNDKQGGDNSRVIIFRGASPAFIAAKPPLAFADVVKFRAPNMEADDAFYQMMGEYTPADITAWIAAAAYTGDRYETAHCNGQIYTMTSEDAIFFSRYLTSGFDVNVTIEHLGANLGEFD